MAKVMATRKGGAHESRIEAHRKSKIPKAEEDDDDEAPDEIRELEAQLTDARQQIAALEGVVAEVMNVILLHAPIKE